MRILLTGRNGQVGWELERALTRFGEVVATDRTTLDLADPDAIRRAARETRPEVIVNAAAYTAVDKAESEPEAAYAINATAPGILAEEAKRLGALLLHYSTDYVFDGTKVAPYSEDDPPNPLNVYGASKLAGERAVQASGCRHLILRTSWVYGPRGRNFFLTIVRKARARETLRIVDDQRGVPTSSAFLARMTLRLLSERPQYGDDRRVYHVVPRGETSWFGFACAIVERLGLGEARLSAISTADYPTPAVRPKYSVLAATRLTQRLGETPPPWGALLDGCIAVLASSRPSCRDSSAGPDI